MQVLKKIVKKLFVLLSPIIYKIKYPSCDIENSLIHYSVKLGKRVTIRGKCKISQNIKIGSYTFMNEYVRVDPNTKSIGRYCSISHNVKIGMGPHPINFISTNPIFYEKNKKFVKRNLYDEFAHKGYTVIENDVLIGANAIILAGVVVGNGAIIGAGSVVTKNVEPYSIVAGNPAKKISKRFNDETVDKLLKTKWWDFDMDDLKEYSEYFDDVEKFIRYFEKRR